MKKNLLISVVSILISCSSFAQDTAKKYCNPKLVGMTRSKGFVISYERTLNSKITSTSDDPSIGNGSATINKNNRLNLSLKIPIWTKARLKMVVGFKYFYEEFNFKSPQGLIYPLYQNLEDKNLKSIGGNLSALLSVNETQYIIIRFNADFNGDYKPKEFPQKSFLKYNFAAIYGWKKCETKTTGVGLYYSYTFGRQFIFPVILYANTFNTRWGIESVLPAAFKFRRNFSEGTILYAGYEVEGNAYHIKIDNPSFSGFNSMELRRSNVRYSLDFEQEIHDWLWFGVSAGIRQPIAANVSKEASKKNDILINNTIGIAPFFNINIFVVPPRTLENKILYGGRSN